MARCTVFIFILLVMAGCGGSSEEPAEAPVERPSIAQPVQAVRDDPVEAPLEAEPAPKAEPEDEDLAEPDLARPVAEPEEAKPGPTAAPAAEAGEEAPAADEGERKAQADEALVARIERLASVGSPEACIEIVSLLNALAESPLRRRAIQAVAAVENIDSAPLLFELIRVGGDEELVRAAQQALGRMPSERVVQLAAIRYRAADDALERSRLLGVVRQTSFEGAAATLAAVALQPAGETTLDPLALAAVDTLAALGTGEAVTLLVDVIQHGPAPLAAGATAALGRVVNPEAMALLAAVVSGDAGAVSDEVRAVAARTLRHGDPVAVEPLLLRLLSLEPDPSVRGALEESLRGIRGVHPDDFSAARSRP